MTSRERLLSVFKGVKPDRIPVSMFILDQGYFISQVYPELDPWDFMNTQKKIIEFQKNLGLDVILRLIYGVHDLHYTHGGVIIDRETENWEVKTVDIKNNDTIIKRSTIKTPGGILTQDFSINELRKGTFMQACTAKPVKTPKDLEIVRKYEPKMSAEYPEEVKKWIKEIKKTLGDSGTVGIWANCGPFNEVSLLISHEELYSLYLSDYEYYELLMNFALERMRERTLAICESGADVIFVGGNVPGGFLGSEIYDRYILPFEKQFIDLIQNTGVPAMYHNCGQIMSLIESYKKLGVKIVEPFSPPPLGDADIEEAIQRVGDAYSMIGGVDQVNVLQKGSIDEIKRVTEKTIKAGKKSNRFILQPADFIEYGTPVENLEAYVKTALENADY